MNERVYSNFDRQSLAWWLMDDGTRANPSGGVRLTIGKQPHYSLEGARSISQWVKEKTGLEGYVVECDDCFRITYTEGVEELLPYFHPNVAYKATYALWDDRIGSQWPGRSWRKQGRFFRG
jgi:hypothetical protein